MHLEDECVEAVVALPGGPRTHLLDAAVVAAADFTPEEDDVLARLAHCDPDLRMCRRTGLAPAELQAVLESLVRKLGVADLTHLLELVREPGAPDT